MGHTAYRALSNTYYFKRTMSHSRCKIPCALCEITDFNFSTTGWLIPSRKRSKQHNLPNYHKLTFVVVEVVLRGGLSKQRQIRGGGANGGHGPPKKPKLYAPPQKKKKKKKKKRKEKKRKEKKRKEKKRKEKKRKEEKKGGKRETKQNPTTLRPLLVQLSLAYTFSFC